MSVLDVVAYTFGGLSGSFAAGLVLLHIIKRVGW